jgi:hypothetical protein
MSEQQLREPDPLKWNEYKDGGAGKPLPPKGEYNLITTKVEKGSTREGYLQYTIDAKVQAPGQPFDGFETRFNRFNTKKWDGREACGLGDYCRAHGINRELNTNADYEAAVNATQGRPFRAMLDWEIYDSATSYSLKGEDNFPQVNGVRQTSIKHPTTGEKLFANVRIKYPISALKK